MSKKVIPILVIATLLLSAMIFALPQGATASPQLGITPTEPPPTEPPPTEPPPTEPPPTEPPPTEPPPTEPPPTEPPPTEPPPTEPPDTEEPSKPKKTEEIVLLPATGEGPLDSSQGMQWFFVLGIIFLIGFILVRELRSAKIKK